MLGTIQGEKTPPSCLPTHCLHTTWEQSNVKQRERSLWPWERLKQFNPIRRREPRGSCSKFGKQKSIEPSDGDTSLGTLWFHPLFIYFFRGPLDDALTCIWRTEHVNTGTGRQRQDRKQQEWLKTFIVWEFENERGWQPFIMLFCKRTFQRSEKKFCFCDFVFIWDR